MTSSLSLRRWAAMLSRRSRPREARQAPLLAERRPRCIGEHLIDFKSELIRSAVGDPDESKVVRIGVWRRASVWATSRLHHALWLASECSPGLPFLAEPKASGRNERHPVYSHPATPCEEGRRTCFDCASRCATSSHGSGEVESVASWVGSLPKHDASDRRTLEMDESSVPNFDRCAGFDVEAALFVDGDLEGGTLADVARRIVSNAPSFGRMTHHGYERRRRARSSPDAHAAVGQPIGTGENNRCVMVSRTGGIKES